MKTAKPGAKSAHGNVGVKSDLIGQMKRVLTGLFRDLDRDPFSRRFFDGDATIPEYKRILRPLYQTTRHNTAFLRTAGEKLATLNRYPALARLYARKAAEEEGHEELILKDLAELGDDVESLLRCAPSRAELAYFGFNDFAIESGHPEAFYGPSYLLEALAMSRATTVERILARGLLPRRALSFLLVHAAADVGHVKELDDALPEIVEPADVEMTVLLAETTRAVYREILSGNIVPGT